MIYFLIESDERYQNRPVVKGIPTDKLSTSDLYNKRYHLLPQTSILSLYNYSEVDFVDVISSPVLFLSDLCLKVAKMYQPKLVSKDFVFIDEKGGQTKTYHLPLFPRIECLTQNSRFNLNKSKIEYAELDFQKVKKHPIFYIGDSTGNYTVIRLDALESMLKRGARGIKITELDMC